MNHTDTKAKQAIIQTIGHCLSVWGENPQEQFVADFCGVSLQYVRKIKRQIGVGLPTTRDTRNKRDKRRAIQRYIRGADAVKTALWKREEYWGDYCGHLFVAIKHNDGSKSIDGVWNDGRYHFFYDSWNRGEHYLYANRENLPILIHIAASIEATKNDEGTVFYRMLPATDTRWSDYNVWREQYPKQYQSVLVEVERIKKHRDFMARV